MMLTITLDNQEARQAIADAVGKAKPSRVAKIVAKSSETFVAAHLFNLSNTRHKAGHMFNFYAAAADAVSSETYEGDALVRIQHEGLALRYFGGIVKPSGRPSLVTGRPIRMLSLPASPEAEQHTPGDFSGLFLIKSRKLGKAYLAGKKSNGMIGILFRLVPQTVHKADATVLPSAGALTENAVMAIMEHFQK
jgi:hypothetical protein